MADGQHTDRVAAIPEDTYARRLMLVRDHAGQLSIRRAAERCGLNYATWANWERGASSRTMVDDARIIAETLGVDLVWLLYGGPLTVPAPRRRRRTVSLTYSRGPIRPGDRSHRPRPRRIDRDDALAMV